MSRSLKIFKGIVVSLIAIVGGLMVIENVYFNESEGLVMLGELELSWDKPSENSDNSPLTDLAGYKIHCWNAAEQQTETIVLEDSEVTSYELDHLRPGTYQCALSAVNSDGSESALSNVVTRTVQ